MTDKECIFCKIAGGEIPSSTVYEDEDFRVILDLGPASKGHALILPKQHFKDLCELDPAIAAKALPLAGKIGSWMIMEYVTGLRHCPQNRFQWPRMGIPQRYHHSQC